MDLLLYTIRGFIKATLSMRYVNVSRCNFSKTSRRKWISYWRSRVITTISRHDRIRTVSHMLFRTMRHCYARTEFLKDRERYGFSSDTKN